MTLDSHMREGWFAPSYARHVALMIVAHAHLHVPLMSILNEALPQLLLHPTQEDLLYSPSYKTSTKPATQNHKRRKRSPKEDKQRGPLLHPQAFCSQIKLKTCTLELTTIHFIFNTQSAVLCTTDLINQGSHTLSLGSVSTLLPHLWGLHDWHPEALIQVRLLAPDLHGRS